MKRPEGEAAAADEAPPRPKRLRCRPQKAAARASLVAEMRELSASLQDVRTELSALRAVSQVGSTMKQDERNKAVSTMKVRQLQPGFAAGLSEGVYGQPADRGKVVVIIGMRGAGKTCLGRRAAEELKRTFVDLDDVAEKEVFHCSINDFVAKQGWGKFREAECSVLKDALTHGRFGTGGPNGCVIACGGGIVETPETVALLKDFFPVIWINRHIDDVVDFLEGSGNYRPALDQSPREVYARRWELYNRCSDYIFTIRKGDQNWAEVDKDFVAFLRHATQVPNHEVRVVPNSFQLTLTYPTIEDALAAPGLLERMASHVDLLEYRADLTKRPLDREWILEELALLRRHCDAPICFSSRPLAQGGRSECSVEQSLELLKLALRAGCEAVDVDTTMFSAEHVEQLAAMKNTAYLVGSFVQGAKPLDLAQLHDKLQTLLGSGTWDYIRVLTTTSSLKDVMALHQYVADLDSETRSRLIFDVQGPEAIKLNSTLNRVLTSITHPDLPFQASPGQMTLDDVLQSRRLLSLYEQPRIFYVIGRPVALSASPIIQNTGFKVNGKPYEYYRYDTPSAKDAAWKLSLASTAGASITIPHKETLMPYLDDLSDAAKAIGGVNTITKEAGTQRLRGDNTDWIGIKNQLLPKVRGRGSNLVGLIVGAGGTARAAAFAFRSMGFKKVFIMNRTYEKAEIIAKEFGDNFVAVKNFEGLGELTRLDAVMGTLPGQAGFSMPDELLTTHRPAVIEAAYRSSDTGSRLTNLLEQAQRAGCEIIEGLEMLFEQGCAQCEMWTGRPAPRREIARAMLEERFPNDPSPPKNLAFEAALET